MRLMVIIHGFHGPKNLHKNATVLSVQPICPVCAIIIVTIIFLLIELL